MNKILFIDDEKSSFSPNLKVDYVASIEQAYKMFASEYVHDIVSLDGRIPYNVLPSEKADWEEFLLKHSELIGKSFRLYSNDLESLKKSAHGGMYLLFLMQRCGYVPKIIIAHSYDSVLAHLMCKIAYNMYYNYPVVIINMDKEYVSNENSLEYLKRSLEEQEEHAKTAPDPSTYFVKLQKGKNYFILTPNEVEFYKKGVYINKSRIKNDSVFIKDKINNGYHIAHGNECLMPDMNFKHVAIF